MYKRQIIRMIVLLILSIYLLYWGLASLFSLYLKKRGKRIYHGTNLFLIRQLSSKIRTMRFTFGTLTVLFTLSLLGCSLALMLNQYPVSYTHLDVYKRQVHNHYF